MLLTLIRAYPAGSGMPRHAKARKFKRRLSQLKTSRFHAAGVWKSKKPECRIGTGMGTETGTGNGTGTVI